ncbi:MAG TPA: hypothetical protein VJT09_04435 [Pyrinomonadaceae bacterium]|nr:hypothetical protein [Pyrinomonadaceae bacterium]
MKTGTAKLLQTHDAKRMRGQQPVARQTRVPGPAQPKMVQDRLSAIQPKLNAARLAAPAVYRPQPTPKVLQTKSSPATGPQTGQAPRRPVAPAVYRPEAKKIVQPKAIAQQRKTPTAPPVYRPEQQRVAQPKMIPAAQTDALLKTRPSRPQPFSGAVSGAVQRNAVASPVMTRPAQTRMGSPSSAPKLHTNAALPARGLSRVIQRDPVKDWIIDVRTIASAHTQIGPEAGFPQEYDRINRGPFRQKDPYEVLRRGEMDPVSVAFGMTFNEETALYKYSQGMKDERNSPGYMERREWDDLASAVNKIPSMGQLGKVATVFRGDRKTDFTDFLRGRIGQPCYILHGATRTAAGVEHLASAAFTVNSHALRAPAIVRIICVSARYIQYWGMHGASLDGGEVLIPSGTFTYYDGEAPHKEKFGFDDEGPIMKDIFTLVEVERDDVKDELPVFDDFKGNLVRPAIRKITHHVPRGKLKVD